MQDFQAAILTPDCSSVSVVRFEVWHRLFQVAFTLVVASSAAGDEREVLHTETKRLQIN
jgi:hypothetical protein